MDKLPSQITQPIAQNSPPSTNNLSPNQKPKRKISLPAILVSILILIIIGASIGAIYYLHQQKKVASINDFENCAAAGNPIMESYPEQCSSNGQTFTRKLTEEEQKKLNLDPTADWKTFEDIMYGYSFKYPIEWNADYACFNRDTVSECSNSVNFIESYSSKKIEEIKAVEGGGSINSSNFIDNILNEANGVIISFYYDGNYEKLNMNDFITSRNGLNLNNSKATEELIGENKFTKISFDDDNKNSTTYLIEDSGTGFVVVKVKIIAKDGNYDSIPNTQYNQYLKTVENILSTFKFTDQNSAVDTSDWKIHNSKTYTALYPQNWNVVKVKPPEQEPQNDEDSAFKSPDYEANLVPAITNGAEISIYKRVNTNNQKLESYIESKLAVPNKVNIKNLKKVNFGSNTYFNLFDCWEGCWDKYYLESGDSFYTITYQCTPNCNSESAIKNNKYHSVKNEFLKNFKLSN